MNIKKIKNIANAKINFCKKIKTLRDWIAYLDENQLLEVSTADIEGIVEWTQKAMSNAISRDKMANWASILSVSGAQWALESEDVFRSFS